MNLGRLSILLFALGLSVNVLAGVNEQAMTSVLCNYLPGNTNFAGVKAKSVDVNSRKKTVVVNFTENASYIPFTAQSYASFKDEARKALGEKYNDYKLVFKAGDADMASLVLFSPKKVFAPKETKNFVTRLGVPAASKGLDGANIAMWQSHGWYFEPKLNRWEWQRARIFQTVEDLYTQSYVMPFLMPMLENAGAYVMSPRERDTQRTEIIIDNDGALAQGTFKADGSWSAAKVPAFAFNKEQLKVGDNPFVDGTSLKANGSGKPKITSVAQWQAQIPADGTYAVYVSYSSLPNSTTAAHYTVKAADGDHQFTVNQKMGGGTWIYLGHFPFKKDDSARTLVMLDNGKVDKKQVVTADAVKIGGGMGHVARIVKEPLDSIDYEYVTSGYPRFTEAARYFLQYAGAPDSVYTQSNNVNDYTDDYKSRGLWVNWLAGGSSVLPDRKGLGIPVDLSFAFHTDAGTTMNDSIIGTLGIYCTNNGDKFENGGERSTSRDLTELIMTQITDDVRSKYEPNWTRRGMWDKSYFEARSPQVPAMLLELLSHQNFADMSYGLDPTFRFTVSRAVYKGMLKYLAARDNRPYVVQPLPIHAFAINGSGAGQYRLNWQATIDSLEETAFPTYYIVEERVDDGAFRSVAKVKSPNYTVSVNDNKIHSYRIIAANDGGISFPSEVLALCNMGEGAPEVTVVNGFTRVSGPDRFDAGKIAGFYDERDHGVPYVQDISFIGSQFEYRRDIPWMDDDAAGFGASRANYEDRVIAGNTFDYVYTHGAAIREAGAGFVSSSVEAFISSDNNPAMVDLILGKQKEIKVGRGVYGTRFKTFPAPLQHRMSILAAEGTNFFVSGSFIATDLWDNEFSSKEVAKADKEFANKVLGYTWRVGQASSTGEAYQVPTRFKAFGKGSYAFYNELNQDFYAVESPDAFEPADKKKGVTLMRYDENNLVAGTALADDTHRAVCIGFPFETIRESSERTHLMQQIIKFFTVQNPLSDK